MPSLSVPCYGGRTFERDNGIVDDVTTLTVKLHHGLYTINVSDQIGKLPPSQPPPRLTVLATPSHPSQTSATVPLKPALPTPSSTSNPPASTRDQIAPKFPSNAVLMKSKTHLLPQGVYPIPCDQTPGSKVLVLPPSPPEPLYSASIWPPQVCDVAKGSALYVNTTESPLHHPKNTHFRLIPMQEESVTSPISCPVNLLSITTHRPTQDSILSQIAVNREILSPDQLRLLDALHKKHLSAFDEDMSEGFQDPNNPYYAKFSFRDENRAPPTRSGPHNSTRNVKTCCNPSVMSSRATGLLLTHLRLTPRYE